MNVKIEGDEAVLSKLKCYALLAPHLDGGGAGNSARSLDIAGQRCLVAWKNGVSLAFGASCGFSRTSCGYVGSSDGYQDLHQHMRMTWNFGQALDGNIALMGEVDVALHREFTVAIALGEGHHSALHRDDGLARLAFRRAQPALHRPVAPRAAAHAAGRGPPWTAAS